MHHLDLLGFLVEVRVGVELLRVHNLLQVLSEGLVVTHGDRTVLAVLLTAIDTLNRVIGVFVWVIERVGQVHNQREFSRILLELTGLKGGVLLLWVVQVVNQAFIVVSEKGLWVVGG